MSRCLIHLSHPKRIGVPIFSFPFFDIFVDFHSHTRSTHTHIPISPLPCFHLIPNKISRIHSHSRFSTFTLNTHTSYQTQSTDPQKHLDLAVYKLDKHIACGALSPRSFILFFFIELLLWDASDFE